MSAGRNSESIKQAAALVMAGGKGQRMAETRPDAPKPLTMLGGIPIIEIVVRQLFRFGFAEIHIALRHKAEMVIDHLTGCSDLPGEHLHFIVEEEPLGTIGALAHLKYTDRTILTTNGDLLSGIDLGGMFDFHRRLDADMTIATHSEYHRLRLGEVESREDLLITDYHEKPVKEYHICSGISLMDKSVLELCRLVEPLQFPDLVRRCLERGDEDPRLLSQGTVDRHQQRERPLPRGRDAIP